MTVWSVYNSSNVRRQLGLSPGKQPESQDDPQQLLDPVKPQDLQWFRHSAAPHKRWPKLWHHYKTISSHSSEEPSTRTLSEFYSTWAWHTNTERFDSSRYFCIYVALIRNVTNSKLTPTFREIIYQMAEKYYPRQWSNIVEETI